MIDILVNILIGITAFILFMITLIIITVIVGVTSYLAYCLITKQKPKNIMEEGSNTGIIIVVITTMIITILNILYLIGKIIQATT